MCYQDLDAESCHFNPRQSVREEPGGFVGAEGSDTVNNRVKEGQTEKKLLGGLGG